ARAEEEVASFESQRVLFVERPALHEAVAFDVLGVDGVVADEERGGGEAEQRGSAAAAGDERRQRLILRPPDQQFVAVPPVAEHVGFFGLRRVNADFDGVGIGRVRGRRLRGEIDGLQRLGNVCSAGQRLFPRGWQARQGGGWNRLGRGSGWLGRAAAGNA